jgi:hypothetical protein
MDFLLLDANARAVALGGAYTALAEDANALLYNPAGLGRVRRDEATFMHNQYYQGVTQDYLALATPQGWGLNANFLDMGGVPQSTYGNPDGAGLSATGMNDLAVGGGYGLSFGGLALGAGVKFLRETIAGVSGQGFALDAGALYDVAPVPGWTVGASAQNMGPTVKLEQAHENLPFNLRLGTAYQFHIQRQKAALSVDLTKERSESAVVEAGAELAAADMFPLRVGYTSANDAGLGLTAGAGYRYRDFEVDYAFAPYGALGDAHRVSVTMLWGKPR